MLNVLSYLDEALVLIARCSEELWDALSSTIVRWVTTPLFWYLFGLVFSLLNLFAAFLRLFNLNR
jgi:hypothetical protein